VPGAATVTIGGSEAGNVALEAGSISGAGVLQVGNGGNLAWSGGTLTGTGTLKILGGGSLDIVGAVLHDFSRADGNSSGGRIIENAGTVRWTAGDVRGGDGAAFNNLATGVVEIGGSGSFGYNGSYNQPTFANAGTLRKTAGATTTFSSIGVTTSGLVDVQAGSLAFTSAVTSNGSRFQAAASTSIAFSGGQTFNTGTQFTGTGLVSATAGATVFNGAISADRFVFSGGTADGTATLTGLVEWAGGNLIGSGTFTVPAASTLRVTGAGNRVFSRADGNSSGGRTLEIAGTMTVENSGDLLGGDGATLVTRAGGLLDFKNDRTFGHNGSYAVPFLVNQGTLRKSAGSGTTTISGSAVTHSGQIDVQTGKLVFATGITSNAGQFAVSGGAALEFGGGQTFNAGTAFTGGGIAKITGGTTAVSGNVSAAVLEFGGGSLQGTGTLTAGTLRWTGGDFRGAGTLTVASGALLLATGAGDRTLQRADGNSTGGRVVENFGTFRVENAGNLVGNDGAQLLNRSGGVFELRNDASLLHGGNGSAPTFTNQGTVAKTAGTGTSTIAVPFVNSGTIAVSAGTLAFTSTFTNAGGAIGLTQGGAVSVPGTLDLGTATLAGAGTITAAEVRAGGQVSPGSSPGTLTVAGNLTLLSTSRLIVELGGTAQGTGYDFLSVTGAAALAGTLDFKFVNGFAATAGAGDTFSILTAASRSGVFLNALAGGTRVVSSDGLGSFLVNYTASGVTLTDFVAVPEPSTYALLALGLGFVIRQVRRRRV
jgi:hypothetical protein